MRRCADKTGPCPALNLDLGARSAAEKDSDVFWKSFIQLAGQPFLQFRLLWRREALELHSKKAGFAPPADLGLGEQQGGTVGQAKAHGNGTTKIQSLRTLNCD